MQTPKEIFLEPLRPDGKPERLLKQYEALSIFLFDPLGGFLHSGRMPGATIIDKWGVTIAWPENHPGSMPVVNDETKVLKDITHWRDYVHAPDIASVTQGWEEAEKLGRSMCGEDKLFCAFMATGLFEQCHFLMGFEDTLTNLYEHPAEMHELIDYLTEYKLQYAKMLIDGLHPDLIFSHDDWGTKDALFMQPDVWREFFKEPYRRLYGYVRSRGVMVVHHADSYLSPIVEDMAEIGIQCWQGVLPENDIPELQQRLRGRMVLMGGIGAAIDRADATEDEIRAYVASALEEYAPGGSFIPSITYGLAGTVFKHVDPFIDDEIEKYNSVLHMPGKKSDRPARRVKAELSEEDKAAVQVQPDTPETLEKLADAIYKGQKAKAVKLSQAAIEEGIPADRIISDALMVGMNRLGCDFTLGKVFVPEMLMAAKAMNAATDYLKPMLQSGGEKGKGRVCLGTVKGDMHDIGKNLVKIMMEGSGLEVIDLGVDVSAEKFIDTAINENCDIISCSSLLTTCMGEMRNVVNLAKERGIRDKVKILVGGAPISQSFCDEIGADAYTVDAGLAARTALRLIGNKA